MCILPLILDEQNGIAIWLTIGSVIFFNAIFHIRGAVKTKKYSPGMITSLLLYIPLTVYGYWYFLRFEKTSVEQAIESFSMGAAYWLFSTLNHIRRAKKSTTLAELSTL
jgi:hypothetical protein